MNTTWTRKFDASGISFNDNIPFTFDAKKQIGYGKILVSGDSGNPSFIMVNGEPTLIETHHTGGEGVAHRETQSTDPVTRRG